MEEEHKCRFCGAKAIEENGVLKFPCNCAEEDFENSIELGDLEYGKGW